MLFLCSSHCLTIEDLFPLLLCKYAPLVILPFHSMYVSVMYLRCDHMFFCSAGLRAFYISLLISNSADIVSLLSICRRYIYMAICWLSLSIYFLLLFASTFCNRSTFCRRLYCQLSEYPLIFASCAHREYSGYMVTSCAWVTPSELDGHSIDLSIILCGSQTSDGTICCNVYEVVLANYQLVAINDWLTTSRNFSFCICVFLFNTVFLCDIFVVVSTRGPSWQILKAFVVITHRLFPSDSPLFFN